MTRFMWLTMFGGYSGFNTLIWLTTLNSNSWEEMCSITSRQLETEEILWQKLGSQESKVMWKVQGRLKTVVCSNKAKIEANCFLIWLNSIITFVFLRKCGISWWLFIMVVLLFRDITREFTIHWFARPLYQRNVNFTTDWRGIQRGKISNWRTWPTPDNNTIKLTINTQEEPTGHSCLPILKNKTRFSTL